MGSVNIDTMEKFRIYSEGKNDLIEAIMHNCCNDENCELYGICHHGEGIDDPAPCQFLAYLANNRDCDSFDDYQFLLANGGVEPTEPDPDAEYERWREREMDKLNR